MNTKAILGISLGAVFAISMIMSPAFAGVIVLPDGTLTGGLLKDHDAGKNKNKSPAHYELQVTSVGNYTDFAVLETSSGTAAVGFGLINSTLYVHAFTSHDFNDCQGNPDFCGTYIPHGHGAQLILPTENCAAISSDLEIDCSTLVGSDVTGWSM